MTEPNKQCKKCGSFYEHKVRNGNIDCVVCGHTKRNEGEYFYEWKPEIKRDKNSKSHGELIKRMK